MFFFLNFLIFLNLQFFLFFWNLRNRRFWKIKKMGPFFKLRGKCAENTRKVCVALTRILRGVRAFFVYSLRILRAFSAQSARAENVRESAWFPPGHTVGGKSRVSQWWKVFGGKLCVENWLHPDPGGLHIPLRPLCTHTHTPLMASDILGATQIPGSHLSEFCKISTRIWHIEP